MRYEFVLLFFVVVEKSTSVSIIKFYAIATTLDDMPKRGSRMQGLVNALSILTNVLQEETVAAKSKSLVSELLEELDIVKVSWDIVCTLVEREVFSGIVTDVHSVGSANSPNFFLMNINTGNVKSFVSSVANMKTQAKAYANI